MTLFIYWSHSWRSPSLFMIAGVGIWFLAARGAGPRFVGGRLLRLLVPAVFAAAFINVFGGDAIARMTGDPSGFLLLLGHMAHRSEPKQVEHLWFLFNLAMIPCCAGGPCLAQPGSRSGRRRRRRWCHPRHRVCAGGRDRQTARSGHRGRHDEFHSTPRVSLGPFRWHHPPDFSGLEQAVGAGSSDRGLFGSFGAKVTLPPWHPEPMSPTAEHLPQEVGGPWSSKVANAMLSSLIEAAAACSLCLAALGLAVGSLWRARPEQWPYRTGRVSGRRTLLPSHADRTRRRRGPVAALGDRVRGGFWLRSTGRRGPCGVSLTGSARCLPRRRWKKRRDLREAVLRRSIDPTGVIEETAFIAPRVDDDAGECLVFKPADARGIVKHHRDDGGLQAGRAFDRQIDRPRRFRLDPVAEAAQRAVGGELRPTPRSTCQSRRHGSRPAHASISARRW